MVGINNSKRQGIEKFLEIEDIGTYYFKADPTDPTWNGATHTVVRGSQGNPNPSTMSLFTSNPPPAIPVINSPDTINNLKFIITVL